MSKYLQKLASLFTAVAINSVFCAASFAGNPFDTNTSAKSYAKATSNQTIIVKAKRLSLQQKADFDKEQMNSKMQIITISAKRLSAADKLSFENTHKKQQQANSMS